MERNESYGKSSAGLTLVEVMIAMALGGLLIFGIFVAVDMFEKSRLRQAAKTEASSQTDLVMQRLTKYVRTRMTAAKDGGMTVQVCQKPLPKSRCLEVRRRRNAGKSTETVERFRIKTSCEALKAEHKNKAKDLGLTPEQISASVTPLCNFKCRNGRKPVINIRHWVDVKKGGYTDTTFPSGDRFGEAVAISGGFCVQTSAEALKFELGVTHLVPEETYKFKLVRRDMVFPLKEDESNIEWLP